MNEAGENQGSKGASLRLLTYNIQAGTSTEKYQDYLTQGWKHVLPHNQRVANLETIARFIASFDIVGLQEVDDGSLRTGFLNQTQFLAERAGFPFWSHQSNRRVSKIARTCNGLLSRLRPTEVHDHKLPGRIPGRGALVAIYGEGAAALVVVIVHLALGRRSRRSQLAFIEELIAPYQNAIVMGDLNTSLGAKEMQNFLEARDLHVPEADSHTFPSWRPRRALDHILVSGSLKVESFEVAGLSLSDHLPVTMNVRLPGQWLVESGAHYPVVNPVP
ncbi:MAG: endonuclease/exonuclease/phosphatase family protein [Xanthomonadales bacterium]|nr:endonuclease/exonuclease/phosphatase family protein [Xanthomonadales bacterium]